MRSNALPSTCVTRRTPPWARRSRGRWLRGWRTPQSTQQQRPLSASLLVRELVIIWHFKLPPNVSLCLSLRLHLSLSLCLSVTPSLCLSVSLYLCLSFFVSFFLQSQDSGYFRIIITLNSPLNVLILEFQVNTIPIRWLRMSWWTAARLWPTWSRGWWREWRCRCKTRIRLSLSSTWSTMPNSSWFLLRGKYHLFYMQGSALNLSHCEQYCIVLDNKTCLGRFQDCRRGNSYY